MSCNTYFSDVQGSYAHIAIIDGSARGHIHIPGDTIYHLEAAEQYFEKPDFHSVIYPESKMNKDPFRLDFLVILNTKWNSFVNLLFFLPVLL